MNSCLILPSPLSSFLLPSGKNHPKSKDLSFTQHDSGASATRVAGQVDPHPQAGLGPCCWGRHGSAGKQDHHPTTKGKWDSTPRSHPAKADVSIRQSKLP